MLIKLPGDWHPTPSLFIPSEGRILPMTKYVTAVFVCCLLVSAVLALFPQERVLEEEDVV